VDKIPVLLDTDPGSDIDDVLALAYLLRQPRCELVGVTTVTGDVAKRSAIIEVVCRAFGREDVPIHSGISDTLAHGPGQPRVPHYDAIAHLAHRTNRPPTAVDFLRETIRSRPGEIVLLSIGPFTNVATLFTLDPEIPSLLRGFVSMAGSFFRGDQGEWNCRCDPSAAYAAVKRSPRQTFVGLDVTMQCKMAPEQVRERLAQPPHDVLLAMAERWFQDVDHITFHDPLAAALVFRPDLCEHKEGRVTVDLEGRTAFEELAGGGHRVCVSVDRDAFFAEYFARL
jgi:purine nucleosidase